MPAVVTLKFLTFGFIFWTRTCRLAGSTVYVSFKILGNSLSVGYKFGEELAQKLGGSCYVPEC
jgi:hypothetical protein